MTAIVNKAPKELGQLKRAVAASLCNPSLDIPLVDGPVLYNRETSYNTTTEVEDALPPVSFDLPLAALKQLIELAHRIQLLSHLWLRTHVKRLNSLRPQHLAKSSFVFSSYPFRKYPDGKEYKFVKSGPATWVEEYRVVRAIWRLQLFCLLTKPNTRVTVRTDDEAPFIECSIPYRQHEFSKQLSLLTKWETDEILCIQDYLDSARISLRAPPSTHDEKISASSPTNNTNLSPTVSTPRGAAPSPPTAYQKYQDVIAVKRSTEAYNFFHRYGLRHPTSPLQRSSWDNFRRLGFGIWDQERMCQMELFRMPAAVRDERGGKDLSIDDVGFTWKSIEEAGMADSDHVIVPINRGLNRGISSDSREELMGRDGYFAGANGNGNGTQKSGLGGFKGLMRSKTKTSSGSGTSSPRTSGESSRVGVVTVVK